MSYPGMISGTFAPNNLDAYVPAPCPRCGATPSVDWADVTCWGDGNSRWMLPTRSWCMTLRCADEKGGNGVPMSTEPQGRRA